MKISEKISQNFNKILLGYIVTVVLYQILWLIAPLRAFIYNSAVLKNVSPTLAVLGLLIFLLDLFDKKNFLQCQYISFLIILIGVFCISSFIYIKLGLSENVKVIIWQVVQMLVFYPMYKRFSLNSIYKMFYGIHSLISVVYIPAVIISLYQFFICKSYIIMVNNNTCRQGFMEGRLFGVFASIYFATLFIAIMMIFSIYLYLKTSNRLLKFIYIIEVILFYLYVVVSKTRSVFIGMTVTIFVFAFLVTKNYISKTDLNKKIILRNIVPLMSSIMSVLCMISIVNYTDVFLKKIPVLYGDINSNNNEPIELSRPDVGNTDISNHRFKIWNDYVTVTSENVTSIIFGNSPGQYMKNIKENFPDKYIVKYIKENFPNMFEQNLIYDTHNSYLSVYVTSGILGVLLLGSFLVLWVKRVIVHLLKKKVVSRSFLFSISLFILISVSAFFDSDLFFKCTSTSVIFWLLLGIIMKIIDHENAEHIENHNIIV